MFAVLDCCGGADLIERAPAFFRRSEGAEFRIFLSASGVGQSSWELPEGRGSLFTRPLIEVLAGRHMLARRGEVYFNDLADHLHTEVQTQAERLFGSRDYQEPNFTGSFGKDSLLFLQKNESFANARVRTQRITRGDLRRRLASAVGGVAALVGLAAGGYWAFLENQQHLKVERNQLVLAHGHPTLSGFGLPRTEWVFPLGPEALVEDGPLSEREAFAFARNRSPEAALMQALRQVHAAEVLTWRGDTAAARQIMREYPASFLSDPNGRDLLLGLVEPSDKDWLVESVQDGPPEWLSAVVEALARFDQPTAVGLLEGLPNSRYLELLSAWKAPCTPALQAWVESYLKAPSARLMIPAVADMLMRTGCRAPVESFLLVDDRHIESAIHALRATNREALSELHKLVVAEIAGDLQSDGFDVFDPALPAKHRMLAVRSAIFARHIDDLPCFDRWYDRFRLDVFDPLDTAGRLNALVAFARNCDHVALQVEVEARLKASLRRGDGAWETAFIAPLSPGPGRHLVDVLEALRHAGASGLKETFIALLEETRDPEFLAYLAERLRLPGADGSGALDHRVPGASELERELLRWLAETDASAAAQELSHRLLETHDTGLAETLAFLDLSEGERRLLLDAAAELERDVKLRVLAIAGEPADVAALFAAPDPHVREMAATFAPLNRRWSEIHPLAKRIVTLPDPSLEEARRHVERAEVLVRTVLETQRAAREWRAHWLEHFGIEEHAVGLLFQRTLSDLSAAREGSHTGF